MKIFCQNCGNPLSEGVLICSKCGFENKIQGRKTKILKFIVFILIIFLISGGLYIFRGKTADYYKKVKIGKGGISIDADATGKENFMVAFAEYEFAELSFEGEDGLEIYKKHIPEIEEIYNKAPWSDRDFFMCDIMKIESECRKGNTDNINDLEKIIRIREEWRERLNNCSKDQAAFEKCKEYHELMDKYPPQKCQNCDEKISELYKIASAIKNSDTASKLFGLVDLLRQQQAFYDDEEFIKLPSLIFDQEYCIAAQSVKWAAVKKMSESEINKAVAGKDIKDKDIALHFIKLSLEREGRQFSKDNILEEIDGNKFNCIQRRVESEKQLDEKWKTINENLVKIDDDIAMLNGNLELDLKTWQSDRKLKN